MSAQFEVAFDWNADGTWVDETAMLRGAAIELGFDRAEDPAAAGGWCELRMDNADRRFSPGNAAGPLAGRLLPGRAVRVRVTVGDTTWTLFRGVVARISPDSGQYGAQQVVIRAEDGMALLARARIGVAHVASIGVVAAVEDVVDQALDPPAADYASSADVLAHYGRAWLPEDTSARDALRTIAAAVYGRFFVARDGTTVFRPREMMQDPSVLPVLTVADDPIASLAVALDAGRVINQVQVIVHPVETVGAPGDLWTARTTLRLAPGETRTLAALFRDASGTRCGGVNVVAPQAGTDYTLNERADGSGFDYTHSPSVTVSAAVEATRAVITLVNNAIGPLYVTSLRVRGQPLVAYDPIVFECSDPASQDAYQIRTETWDLALQADAVFGEALASYLIRRRAHPALQAEVLRVRNRAGLDGGHVFGVELLDKVRVSDSQSGLDGVDHRVRRVAYRLDDDGWEAALYLEAADALAGWLLDEPGYSLLEINTRLGL